MSPTIQRSTTLLALLFAGCGEAVPPEEGGATGVLSIEGATIFTSPYTPPLEDGVVLVVNGVIEAVGARGTFPIPPAAVRLEAEGLALVAGFWNVHVEIGPELLNVAASGSTEELQRLVEDRFTRFGFTTVVDPLNSGAALAPLIDRIQSGEVLGPRIVATGGATVPGVHWAGVGELLASEDPLPPLAAAGSALVPSLSLLQADLLRAPPAGSTGVDASLAVVLERLRSFSRSGGKLLFGTGAGREDQYDPLTDHLLLEEAGIVFSERLAALASEPAIRFEYLYLGEIETGMVADLVLLGSDPEGDATAFGDVRFVLREGRTLFVR